METSQSPLPSILSTATTPLSAAISPQSFLRVYIGNSGSTVIPTTSSTTIRDVLLSVAAKRSLSVSTLVATVVTHVGGAGEYQVTEEEESRRLCEFGDLESVRVDSHEAGLVSTGSLHAAELVAANAGTVPSSPRPPGHEFRLVNGSKSGFSSAVNLTDAKMMFRKVIPSASDLVAAFRGSDASAQNGSTGTVSGLKNKLRMSGTQDTVPTDPQKSELAVSGSTSGRCSTTASYVGPEASLGVSNKRESKRESTLSVGQKDMETTSQLEGIDLTKKPEFLSEEGAKIRKLANRKTRSRANSSRIQEVSGKLPSQALETDDPSVQYAILLITLPNFRSISVRTPTDVTLDEILSFVCDQHNIDFEVNTFVRNDSAETTLEMDRSLGYLVNELKVPEVFVMPGEKIYRSTYLSEDGADVMIMQTVQGRPQVMAGTPQKLIDRLTSPNFKEDDKAFRETLLLTFRSFMPATEFFRQLVSRYNCVPPENGTEEDMQYFEKMKLPIQRSVAAVCRMWAQHHWHDFALNAELKTQLEQLAEEFSYNDDEVIQSQSRNLLNVVEDQVYFSLKDYKSAKHEEMYSYYKMVERKGKVLESMIAELSPEVLSHQICIHNFKLFKNIHPIEFLHQIWGSDREMTPYLNFFIDRFDKESYWVATEIVMQKDLKKRSSVLSKFILTTKVSLAPVTNLIRNLQACQEANNFFTLFSFMSGLGLSPVSRLKKTWEVNFGICMYDTAVIDKQALPEKTKTIYAELEKLIDPSRNMKSYRDLLAKAAPPIVPFLPIYLKDLTFMNDGNSKMVQGMINFEKLRMMGNRVRDIVSLVAVEYKGDSKPHIQNYIAKPPVEKNMAKLKEMSVECEK
ncbi:hypothetical protein HDU82_001020 [Entophlyctis luteolus]|nr:hypothetical protein HDU82_001020 [Entophlyctis luteolus]